MGSGGGGARRERLEAERAQRARLEAALRDERAKREGLEAELRRHESQVAGALREQQAWLTLSLNPNPNPKP